MRDVNAVTQPRAAQWLYGEPPIIVYEAYEKCKLRSRISRIRPFVGLVSQYKETEWFAIHPP